MSAAAECRNDVAVPEDEAGLRWTVHPLVQESWGKTGGLIGIVVGLSVGAAISFSGVAYGLVSFVVLAVSLSRYWVLTRYELDEYGVQIEHLGRRRRRSWGEFRRIDVLRDGVFLSPFVRASRLDSFRGLFVRCVANRDAVVEFTRRHVAAGSSRG